MERMGTSVVELAGRLEREDIEIDWEPRVREQPYRLRRRSRWCGL